jgi:hypothetical protein
MEINKEYFLSHPPQFISTHSVISSQILTATIDTKKLTKGRQTAMVILKLRNSLEANNIPGRSKNLLNKT